ncbi:hypothetical protein C84B14_09127 [Salinisphaera sp. C84B14]
MLFATIALSACGDGASKSNFKSLIEDAVAKADPATSGLALTLKLPDVSLRGDNIALDVSQPTISYAALQALVRQDILERVQRDGDVIEYALADKNGAKKIIGVNGDQLVVFLGKFVPDTITNFTKPSDEVSNPDSMATVDFKVEYAGWLSDDGLETLRDWYGIAYAARYQGDNPAKHTATEAVQMAQRVRTAHWDASRTRAAKQHKRVIQNWASLAFSGMTIPVRLHKSDDGWRVADPVSDWVPTDFKSIEPKTNTDLQQAGETIATRLNPDVEPPGKVDKAAIDQAFTSAVDLGRSLSVSSPFKSSPHGLVPVSCTIDPRRGWNQINMHYDCNENRAKQLNQLAAVGLVTRAVPGSREVSYTPTDKLKDIVHNGKLPFGTRKVQTIEAQQSSLNWDGQPMVSANVMARTVLYDWVGQSGFEVPDVDTESAKHYGLTMVQNEKKQWRVTSMSTRIDAASLN